MLYAYRATAQWVCSFCVSIESNLTYYWFVYAGVGLCNYKQIKKILTTIWSGNQ